MTLQRGTGLGAGMALGTAAVIRERGGIPMLPAIPERIAAQIASHRMHETPEVVLVAHDYRTALALAGSLTWAKVVAIATETAPPDAPVPPFPAVVNLRGLMKTVDDDVLMLVDAGNNFVFPDPDPIFLGQYTAEHDRVAPKRRIYLDEAHNTAATLDGHTLQVIACITSPDEIEMAMGQGADGLFVPCEATFFQGDEEEQRRSLLELVSAAPGKPLILADTYRLPLLMLLETATKAEITLCEPPDATQPGLGLAELTAQMQEMENICFDNNVICSLPRLGALLVSASEPEIEPNAVDAWIERLAECGATRLVFSLDEESLGEGALLELEPRLRAAGRNLLPTYVAAIRYRFNDFGQNDLENTLETTVRLLVGAEISGIIVEPDAVDSTKRLIRGLVIEECRERYWRVLRETEGGA